MPCGAVAVGVVVGVALTEKGSLPPPIPRGITVTRCPPAFVAECSATLPHEAIVAIREHDDWREQRWQERVGSKKANIVFGRKAEKAKRMVRPGGDMVFGAIDMMDELPVSA